MKLNFFDVQLTCLCLYRAESNHISIIDTPQFLLVSSRNTSRTIAASLVSQWDHTLI